MKSGSGGADGDGSRDCFPEKVSDIKEEHNIIVTNISLLSPFQKSFIIIRDEGKEADHINYGT